MKTKHQGMGGRLKAAREAKGFKREHVAVRISKCSETIARIEREQTSPTVDDFMAMAELLDVDPMFLLLGKRRRLREAA